MSYVALYRKWRPQTFDDVIGQDHIVTTLRNAILTGKLSHAYLFCGTRGTGKTSLAHIISRAANCTDPQNGNPCNKCDTCTGIIKGSIHDVMEIDAASNNSVDNIRQLREDVVYSPAFAKYKVYIIDEVHMLSSGAFNALLKTLEEPPEYVLFILATTEPHKLPATILSRCQRFDFKRIASNTISDRLKTILDSIGIKAGDGAVPLIVKLSGGSARDAISILDQCIAAAESGVLTRETVMNTVGLISDGFLCVTADILLNQDVKHIYAHVRELLSEGRDIKQYVQDLTGYFRNLMIMKFGADRTFFPEVQDEIIQRMSGQSARADSEWLIVMISELSSFENTLKNVLNPGILLEVTLARLCLGQFHSDGTIEALNARISLLEQSLEETMSTLAAMQVQGQVQIQEQVQIQAVERVPIQIQAQAADPMASQAQASDPVATQAQAADPIASQAQASDPTPPQALPEAQLQTQPKTLPDMRLESQPQTQFEPLLQALPDAQLELLPQAQLETLPHANPQEPVPADPVPDNVVEPSPDNVAEPSPEFIDRYSWIKALNKLKSSGNANLYSMLFNSEAIIFKERFYILLSPEAEPFLDVLRLGANFKIIGEFIGSYFKDKYDIKIIPEDKKPSSLGLRAHATIAAPSAPIQPMQSVLGQPPQTPPNQYSAVQPSVAQQFDEQLPTMQPPDTQPHGTQPTDTQPHGTQPTDTQPPGTQPTDAQPPDTQPTDTKPLVMPPSQSASESPSHLSTDSSSLPVSEDLSMHSPDNPPPSMEELAKLLTEKLNIPTRIL